MFVYRVNSSSIRVNSSSINLKVGNITVIESSERTNGGSIYNTLLFGLLWCCMPSPALRALSSLFCADGNSSVQFQVSHWDGSL